MATQASVYIVMRSTAPIVRDDRTLRLKRDLEYLYLFVERPVPVVEGEEACRLLKLCADLFFDIPGMPGMINQYMLFQN